ncbi:CtpF protein [Zhengella mangrovi]|uniref:CtpF protein n=1 Tax=Zhengella mangrovi TaxID=1982044 RepID=A0A2G1QV50_9HYPH|nr:CpaE family protein [Zhengella mangrovi]PHP69078.1 CtpF protein [Zhengella mangrovi]
MDNLAYDQQPAADYAASARDMAELQAMRPVPRVSIHAFCETEGVAKPVERAAEDRRMARVNLKVMRGGVAAAAEYYSANPTPNLIVVESRRAPGDMLAELESLAEVCDPSTRVVIVGHYNDVGLYRELVRNGISEYMVAPITLADIMTVVSNLFVNPDAEPLGRTIAFVGAKGGVGSSTLAHNAAWSISQLFQTETIIADMDLPFGTANINFDQDPAQGIAEAVFSPERVDEVYLDRLLAKCSEHLSLLAAPSTLDRVYDFPEDAFMSVVEVVQRTAPLIVLDVPHTWNAWTRDTLAQADEVVLVATPELANLRNTKNLVDTLKRMRPNDSPPKLILNQVGIPKRPEIEPADFSGPLDLDPIAIIPFDPQLFGTAANNGRMLGEMDASHAVSHTVNEIAHILTGRMEIRKKENKGLAGILGRLGKKK